MPFDRYPAVDQNLEFAPEVIRANMPLSLTTAQRDTISSARKWDGRQIYNSTTRRYERWDSNAGAWRAIAEQQDLFAMLGGTDMPLPDAQNASRGVSSFVSKVDHVHPRAASDGTSSIYWDANTNVNAGTRVFIRGSMVWVVFEFSVKIDWNGNWLLIILPTGYRPPLTIWFGGFNASTGKPGRASINTAGELRFYDASPLANQTIYGHTVYPFS